MSPASSRCLISASPGLAGDVDIIEEIIEQTAVPLTSSQGCGGIGSTDVPNNVFGWGRIDALAAFNFALDFRVVVAPETMRSARRSPRSSTSPSSSSRVSPSPSP